MGVVATNQLRKDWGLVAAVCRGLLDTPVPPRFWWHVDVLVRHWNIPSLIEDFGLAGHVEITSPPMDDAALAERYRGCSVTLHPGLGEGFGFPIFESLACGIPAVHGDYAGGASVMSTCGVPHLLVQPAGWRMDPAGNALRPVYEPADWVRVTRVWMGTHVGGEVTDHLRWKALAGTWVRWFREGL